MDDRWVPEAARHQHGAFTRRQALEAGATAGQIRWRVSRGAWVPVAGVALRHAATPVSHLTTAHAAHLTWPDGVLVLGAAARLHRLPVPDDPAVDVLVYSGRGPQRCLRPHRFQLDDGDVVELLGLPVTALRRTILDCLGRLHAPASTDLLAWVASRKLLPSDALASWVAEHPGRWGNRARARAVARLASGAVNPAEDALHAILRRARITGWVAGASLHEYVGVWANADVYFPAVRLVIEVDGRRAHSSDEHFQADRTRQNRLVAAGCTVLRYTWYDLVTRPRDVAAQIQAMLARLSSSTSARQES